eukprot:TRINITY_DN2959_c0_g1_i1.p1 TRINITY_DN2959_c0_g1~~TRINITY_DN2959_c0_g1_i1.p1  ORF type:complete len:169 (+),score=42.58 TRINITY_DN2959_c0_g1_i1:58-564(+)
MGILSKEEKLELMRAEVALQEEKVAKMKEEQKERWALMAKLQEAMGQARAAHEDIGRQLRRETCNNEGTDCADYPEDDFCEEESLEDCVDPIHPLTIPSSSTVASAMNLLTAAFEQHYIVEVSATGGSIPVLSALLTSHHTFVTKSLRTGLDTEGGPTLCAVLLEEEC